jgi:hypothetical protein
MHLSDLCKDIKPHRHRNYSKTCLYYSSAWHFPKKQGVQQDPQLWRVPSWSVDKAVSRKCSPGWIFIWLRPVTWFIPT